MMNISAPFIARPVATTLLTLGVLLAGIMGFINLAVAPLPKIEFPTISVSASLPGALRFGGRLRQVGEDLLTIASQPPSASFHATSVSGGWRSSR